MNTKRKNSLANPASQIKPLQALIDLVIFLAAMFLIREVHIEQIGFWGNALLRSISTVGVATLLLYYRKQSWRDIGLIKPYNIWKMLGIAGITFISTIVCIIVYKMISPSPEEATEVVEEITKVVKKSLPYQISIVFFIWLESLLEELQDRGFSLIRFESLFGNKLISTILAVLFQAIIFGFRHSYDLSDRSITTGLIGLVFGIVYVLSGRNLWPLIIAHIILNSMSLQNHL
ncbi:CPBP family intramembrane glutamic endopeptidase [Ekhidna sp.]|uniref:CPBP family intramembrane glutamic endopeptidase n=1 Tax=Ekhidna sp. TaxID=2608089 RepID=UPI003CCB883F